MANSKGKITQVIGAVVDVQDTTPLGEAGPGLVVLGGALGQVVDALGDGLAIGPGEGNHSLVDLDARQHALGLHDVHERGAFVVLLEKGLLEENDAGDVLLNACRNMSNMDTTLVMFNTNKMMLDCTQPTTSSKHKQGPFTAQN